MGGEDLPDSRMEELDDRVWDVLYNISGYFEQYNEER